MARAKASATTPLAIYNAKRDFSVTAEPSGQLAEPSRAGPLVFVVQKHWASRLHYDFRLELDGVMLSWACPKGLSFDPAEKRIAIHVEDHPVSYNTFEGTIPEKQYGAGTVIVWDRGHWEPVGDPREGMTNGKLVFHLHGQKLAGLWELVRIGKPGDKQEQWMLFKKRDAWARTLAEYDVISALPDSVIKNPLGPIEEREPRGTAMPPTEREPDLARARKAPLPEQLDPQLATLATTPPSGAGWIVETKFDGYRITTRIDKGKARLITRGGHDWTTKMRDLASAIDALGIGSAWLDGEIVVLNAQGLPDFNALQNAMDNSRSADIAYFLFDVPYLDGQDLRAVPLVSRRAVLKALLEGKENERVRFSQSFPASPAQMLQAACEMKLEGIMLKRADAPYVSARTETWLKLKCTLRQEFVICGFTDRAGGASEVGGLLLGYHQHGVLRYGGSVGTGWDSKAGVTMHAQLRAIEVDRPPIDPKTAKPGRWSKRVIVMPDNAPQVKVEATRALGAEVVFVGPASSARKSIPLS